MKWAHHWSSDGGPLPLLDGFPAGEAEQWLVERETVSVTRWLLPDGRSIALKRYLFPRATQRWRGALRHTFFGQPKPVREASNLQRLRRAGVPAAEPLAWAVARTAFGFVRDGWIATRWMEGSVTLERALAERAALPPELWQQIGESVRRIHDAGCWYRNLCPRNLLLRDAGEGASGSADGAEPEFVWIDPAKSRWQPAPLHAAHALSDLLIFLAPVEDALPAGAWAAVMEGYGAWPGARTTADLLALLPGVARSAVQAGILRERRRWQIS